MKKLVLEYEHPLQGKFTLHKLNLLLTFQVNCPGCFSYALPLFNKLLEEYPKEEVSFLALSTAFEDFDKNTLANTKNLVHTGKLVGELHSHSLSIWGNYHLASSTNCTGSTNISSLQIFCQESWEWSVTSTLRLW